MTKQISICPDCYNRFENDDFKKSDLTSNYEEGQILRCPHCGCWNSVDDWEVEEVEE